MLSASSDVGLAVSATVAALSAAPPDSLRNYSRDHSRPLPSWITVSVVPTSGPGGAADSAATVALTANPTSLLADSIYKDTVLVRAEKCVTSGGTCTKNGTFKTFKLAVAFVIERGFVVGAADA